MLRAALHALPVLMWMTDGSRPCASHCTNDCFLGPSKVCCVAALLDRPVTHFGRPQTDIWLWRGCHACIVGDVAASSKHVPRLHSKQHANLDSGHRARQPVLMSFLMMARACPGKCASMKRMMGSQPGIKRTYFHDVSDDDGPCLPRKLRVHEAGDALRGCSKPWLARRLAQPNLLPHTPFRTFPPPAAAELSHSLPLLN